MSVSKHGIGTAMALLVLTAGTGTAIARDAAGEFAVFSVGGDTCTDYLASRRRGGDASKTYEQWLLGYLSAFNLIVAGTYDIAGKRDRSQLIAWLDRYCNENSGESFVNAAAALTISLYPERDPAAPAGTLAGKTHRHLLQSAQNLLGR